MQKGARLAGELTTVNELLLGSEGGLSQFRQAARRLDRMAAEHPLLAAALASLDRAVIEASEAEAKLDAASDALSFDPARLRSEEQASELQSLLRIQYADFCLTQTTSKQQ